MFNSIMLSFSKLSKYSKDLKFIFGIKFNEIKENVNAGRSYPISKKCLFQLKSCSTLANKDEVIPLEEINYLSSNNKDFNPDKIALLMSEITRYKTLGRDLPQYIKFIDVRDILECETPSQRSKYLKYLFKKEQKKLKSKEKKLKYKLECENKPVKIVKNNHIQYGLGKNTLFLKSFKRSLFKYYEKRLANAVLFGQKIVIDLGYDSYMTKKEKKACSSQIRLLYSFNRLHRNPYDMYICNARSESRCVEYLRYEMPTIDESFATLTEQSYLDIFPNEKLVYLSPHASEALATYDHKAVYIIGGFVDTVKQKKVSSFKAQEEGIKSYRLPLDEFAMWGIGSKSLTINQVFSILMTMRDTGDWKEAFKHLPSRKLKKIDANSDNALHSEKLYVVNNN